MESHSFTQTPPEQSVSKQVLYQTNPKRSDFYKYRIGYAVKASRQAYEHGLVPIDASAGPVSDRTGEDNPKLPWFHLPYPCGYAIFFETNQMPDEKNTIQI